MRINIRIAFMNTLFSLVVVNCFVPNGFAQEKASWKNPMVQQFYEENHQTLYWFASAKYIKGATQWIDFIESSDDPGFVLDKSEIEKIHTALNSRRTIDSNYAKQVDRQIANIPSAEAEYYKNDVLVLKMRTVVGRKSSPTPAIASHITSIVTFPYWNVPQSIAVDEILPKVSENYNYLEQHNFDVVDAKGNLIDDSELNWQDYNAKNFPYFFRQSTGADNSLGVLKFYLRNPFSIFLHATSWQGAFAKENRFLSHGCVRLEKPFELADAMLNGKIDLEELKGGKKGTEPTTITLERKVPVFIIYNPVVVEGDQVTFLKDMYGLIK